ncbi:hypothetical protein L550_2615 [Bordetella pertussis H973]|uniref:Uncharacterized protein n=1 Tax=Bordetella pertussis CHLA-26 TaxID=1331284 RepID=A0AAI9J4Y7_BORPT|nr:hypothetical protein V483_2248 [Bordetella pertussis CHLA-11]ETH02293.1 hypothetical protein L569_2254 [Bordetella pertussis 2250905]ETH03248.1 hypothetical protein L570_2134 [Bordetella pertussis 2356847]ETH08265.1 hypothetical protein L571_2201 [Bordetella pertussis 2371640]ETH10798.1 hypothetical protein L574_2718 [Bordetella pertussis STO1-SEAT-0006]ETH15575.1 hypothetical protein L575_1163 [Bordetella pertussis STO1-SEAT-0007]ETH18402.1 hypothetical protein L563_2154 [Bordetella pertu
MPRIRADRRGATAIVSAPGRHGISRRPSARPPGAARTGSGPPPPFKFLSSRFRFLYY